MCSTRRWTLGAGIALVLLLGGCGDTDEKAKELSPPRLTKAQLVERMGDICQEHTDRQVREIERFEQKRGWDHENLTQGQFEREIVVVMLPIVRDTIHDLGELRPARSEEAKFDAFLDALDQAVRVTQAHPEKLAAEAGEEPFAKARKAAAALEAYYCGQA